MAEGIYIAERNGHCQHCGHRFFSSAPNPAPLCYHCKSAGRVTVLGASHLEDSPRCERMSFTSEPATAPEPITYLGQPVNAPGFTQDQFERAMLRAFCDDLQITPYHDGRHLVGYPNVYAYLVTRERCTCPAGCAGTPCKHRAFLIACLDIREPHVRREWAKLNREHRHRCGHAVPDRMLHAPQPQFGGGVQVRPVGHLSGQFRHPMHDRKAAAHPALPHPLPVSLAMLAHEGISFRILVNKHLQDTRDDPLTSSPPLSHIFLNYNTNMGS